MIKVTVKFDKSGKVTMEEAPRVQGLVPKKDTPQDKPRQYYVYGHLTPEGKYFYIGKGIGDRAWSKERHSIWHRFVNNHLNGQYSVIILQDNLSSDQAEELESEWIYQEGENLVNWISDGRKFDFEAIDRYHKLRNANRELIAKTRELEPNDLERAAALYIKAIETIDSYAFMELESGLVGQLLSEESQEFGVQGEIEAINRLSICLIKLGRLEEAATQVHNYFEKFKADTLLATYEPIKKRIEKALLKVSKNT